MTMRAGRTPRAMIDVEEVASSNLFLVLGKYVDRQDENLLTQSLVLLFNRVEPFRHAFCGLLAKRFYWDGFDYSNLRARSQIAHKTSRGRILVDIEICQRGQHAPLVLIECKLDSGLGPGQLNKYRSALRKLAGSARLVILTRYGVDDSLWKLTPRNTVWLSWSLVAELAAFSARRASRLDKFLLKDFLSMASLKGIHTIARMTTDSIRRLEQFSHFTCDKSQRLNHKTIIALDLAFCRLEEHRDSAWEGIFAPKGNWKPYQSTYKWKDRWAVLQVGYWRLNPRPHVRECYIALELVCSAAPRLIVVRGGRLAPTHARYKRQDPYVYQEYWCTAAYTRRLLKMSMPQATKDFDAELRRIGRIFLKSAYVS